MFNHLLIHNSSITAISFGIIFILLILNYKWLSNNNFSKILFYSLLIALLYKILIYNSRIIWFATFFSLIVVSLKKQVPLKISTLYICIITVTSVALLYYKINSTIGRLFIYKINIQIIKSNFIRGIDKPYNVVFNHTQANNFNISNLNSSNALLASNGYFPFNEYLGIFIEFGITGFIVFSAFILYLLNVCFQQLRNQIANKAFIAIIIFFLIVAMVSYPFSFGIYTVIFIFCTTFILQDIEWIQQSKSTRLIFWVINIVFYIVFLYKDIISYSESKKIEVIKKSFRVGYFNESLHSALKEIEKKPNNGELNYLISKIYFQINKTDSSLHYIHLAHQYLCTDELHFYWGNYYKERKDLENAKEQYLQATYIVPNRFKNRLALIDAYIKLHNKDSALIYSSLTANLTEKIPSTLSNFYKQKAIHLRDSLLCLKNK